MPVRNLFVAIGCLSLACGAFGQTPTAENAAPITAPSGSPFDPASVGSDYGTYPLDVDGGLVPQLGQGESLQTPPVWDRSAFMPMPKLEVRLEVLWLQPNFGTSQQLFSEFRSMPDGTVVSNPLQADLNTNYVSAGRADARLRFGPNHSLDTALIYLGGPDAQTIVGQRDGRKFTTPGVGGGFLTNVPAGFPTAVDEIVLDWQFETFGVDTNLMRHWVPLNGPFSEFALGVGVGFLFFDERNNLQLNDEANATTSNLNVKTENMLIGPQLATSTKIQLPWKRLRVTADGRVGFMVNATETRTRIDVAGAQAGSGSYNRTQFSPIAEGNAFVELSVTSHMTVFGGFQLLWAGRVDRSVEQYTQSLTQFVVDHKSIGDVFMFGPRAGLLMTY